MTRLFNEANNAQDDNMSFHKMPREGVRGLNKSLQESGLSKIALTAAEVAAPRLFKAAEIGAQVGKRLFDGLNQHFEAKNAPSGPALH